jgi:hypothetical protein
MKRLLLLFLAAVPCFGQQTKDFFAFEAYNASEISTVSVPWSSERLLSTNCKWYNINPSAGVVNFTACDVYITAAVAAGVDVYYVLHQTPTYASSTPAGSCGVSYAGSCYAPSDIDGANTILPTFLNALVSHYAGQIKAYTCWNEPDDTNNGWKDTLAHLGKVCQDLVTAVRANDPSALVFTPEPAGTFAAYPGAQGLANWFTAYFAAGGPTSVDGVAIHGYFDVWTGLGGANPQSTGYPLNDPELSVDRWQYLQPVLVANGLSAKPVWVTETGWGAQTTWTLAQASAWDFKNVLINLSQGMKRQYFYLWANTQCTPGISWGVMYNTTGSAICANGTNRNRLEGWLIGSTLASPFCSQSSDDTWVCTLVSNTGKLGTFIWNSGSQAQKTVNIDPTFASCTNVDGTAATITSNTINATGSPVFCSQ